MPEPRSTRTPRFLTLVVNEHAGTPQSCTRHFEAILFPDGEVHVTGLDDESWITFSPMSAGALLLSAILDPLSSTIDQPRLSPLHWAPIPA